MGSYWFAFAQTLGFASPLHSVRCMPKRTGCTGLRSLRTCTRVRRVSSRLPLGLLVSILALAAIGWEASSCHAADPLLRSGKVVAPSVSFELDVQPILAKAGCNTGACHGKQRGQNGFQLSLLGFDSEFDFRAITREARGRRVSPANPAQSLLLLKAIGATPHGGGARFTEQSEEYATMHRWIAEGASRRLPHEPLLETVELSQTEFRIAPQATAQLQLTARYSDGSQRDVTRAATYLSNEQVVAQVDETGQLQAGELPGETAIMARYMNHICVANVVIPRGSEVADLLEQLPRYNFVDELVYRKLAKTGVLPAQEADEHVFLRRAYIDIIGRIPTVDEARRFLDSASANKREALVDELLAKPEYGDHWANQWADALRPNPYRVGIKAVLNYDNWIRQQFREEVPYDEFVRRLVAAQGSTWRNGAVTLFRDRRSPDEMATLVSQLFLGVRLECAKCHHHPFEKWSQRDFYQFAAFFGQVKHKGTGLSPPISGSEESIYLSSSKSDVRHPVTEEVLAPRPLFGEMQLSEGQDPREALVDWMTSPENDYFAQVQANRVWALMMGRGLVEPVDDLRSTNPPSNPELLDALADYFREQGYQTKELIKVIALSRVYGLSSAANEANVDDRLNYARHYRHRLRAEVLLDAATEVTETRLELSGVLPLTRSNQIWTHRVSSNFLDTFGRPDPNQDPPCERTSESTVTQALHMMNSKELDRRVSDDGGRAARLAQSDLSHAAIVDELYLAIYARRPSPTEAQYAVGLLDKPDADRRHTIEDLMWALLNTPEFLIQN